jgi:Ser/Thr protein kinase RdoA (MazF antagonist)
MPSLLDALDAEQPPIPPEAIAALAAARFGLDAAVTRLRGERDQNFCLVDRTGATYVLKVHPPDEDPGVVDLQTRALQRIASVDPSFPAPRVCLDREGQPYAPWAVFGPPQLVRLLTWVEGPPMEEALPLEADGLRSLGAAMARLDAALAGLRHPAESHPLPWDLQHTAELEAHASEIPAGALREAAARGRARFVERVAPRLGGLRAQLIHNDWNLHNVRMAEGRFCGLLDFGDLVRGPLIQELAVAASYHCRRSADPMAPIEGLLAGFGPHTPLTDEELDLLPDLIVARGVLTLPIASHSAEGEDDHIEMRPILEQVAGSMVRLLDTPLDLRRDRLTAFVRSL